MKNSTLRGEGGFTKNWYRGGDCLKRGAWTVCIFKGKGGGGWQGRGGGVFDGEVDTLMHNMSVKLSM